MPLNVMDAHFRSFTKLVIRKRRRWAWHPGDEKHGQWRDFEEQHRHAAECLQYALTLPTSVVITGIDGQSILDQALQAATSFKPLSSQQIAAILKKTEQAAGKGEYELFKTSGIFDSTAKHPEWLGPEAPNVQKLGGDV